jgi:hypothetical protein
MSQKLWYRIRGCSEARSHLQISEAEWREIPLELNSSLQALVTQEDSGLDGFILKGFGQSIAWMVTITAGIYKFVDSMVMHGT